MSAKKRPGSQRNKPAARAPLRSEAWTSEGQAVRNQMAITLRICRQHYRKTMPGSWRFMVRAVRIQMLQTQMDCQELDRLREARGLPPFFQESCATFNDPRALAALHYRTLNESADGSEQRKPSGKALTEGIEGRFEWKFTLQRFRESLRDGRSPEECLQIHADSIAEVAEKGTTGFFGEFADLIQKHRREPLVRSLTGWIVRGWLPLCLWECAADGDEARRRFCHAADLLGLSYKGHENEKFKGEFFTAWRNLRTKKYRILAKQLLSADGPARK